MMNGLCWPHEATGDCTWPHPHQASPSSHPLPAANLASLWSPHPGQASSASVIMSNVNDNVYMVCI